MNFLNIKNRASLAEALAPLFVWIFSSLVFCAMVFSGNVEHRDLELTKVSAEILIDESEPEDYTHFFTAAMEKAPDLILERYNNPGYREWVIELFSGICSNREIAEAILVYSDQFDIPPALAFALGWEESRFNPKAVNNSNKDGSIDRGLFQLNSKSFPNLELAGFFNIDKNTLYGMRHLRFCMDQGGSEIAALAMYNAGPGKVSNTGAPKVTLDYIHRIFENREKIENHFNARFIREEETRRKQSIAAAKPQRARTITSTSPL